VKKILGVGTALVDVICQVQDDVIQKLQLNKGSMTLIEEDQIQVIRSHFEKPLITSGGSVCNTIHELNYSTHEAAFYGKVSNDEYGKAFIQDLEQANITYQGVIKENDLPTGCCNILVSTDGERTMATHIGIGSQLRPDEINEDALKQFNHIYMESYLWDHELTKQTLQKVGQIAKQNKIETSLSLSDPFCVDRHRNELKDFINDYDDSVISNIVDAKMNTKSVIIANVSSFIKIINKIILMTASAEGAYYFERETVRHRPSHKISKVLDTTGAGDNFAAGFLETYLLGHAIEEALENGNTKAGKVIQQLGPRIKRS